MKRFSIACTIVMVLFFLSCSENKNVNMNEDQHINEELKKITALLRDSSFALEMAKTLEASYYISQGRPYRIFYQLTPTR
jgi:hypothetical protein